MESESQQVEFEAEPAPPQPEVAPSPTEDAVAIEASRIRKAEKDAKKSRKAAWSPKKTRGQSSGEVKQQHKQSKDDDMFAALFESEQGGGEQQHVQHHPIKDPFLLQLEKHAIKALEANNVELFESLFEKIARLRKLPTSSAAYAQPQLAYLPPQPTQLAVSQPAGSAQHMLAGMPPQQGDLATTVASQIATMLGGFLCSVKFLTIFFRKFAFSQAVLPANKPISPLVRLPVGQPISRLACLPNQSSEYECALACLGLAGVHAD